MIKTDIVDKLGCDIDIESELGVVIYDEVHYINDKDRGKVWEESLIMMPHQVQLILLSAATHKPEVFAGWIQSISQEQVNLIEYHHRPFHSNILCRLILKNQER